MTARLLTVLLVPLFLFAGGCAPTSEWQKAHELSYKRPAELKAQHEKEKAEGLSFNKIIHGDPAIKAVALTFDDGPHEKYTPQILAILKKYRVRATFFVVGSQAEKYPDLIRAEYGGGNTIGNHTYNHLNLTRLHTGSIKAELLSCNYVVKSILGIDLKYFRPPGGDYDRRVINASTEEGFTMVLWSDDPGDYKNPGKNVIEKKVLEMVGNGGIIILHDGVQQTIDILPQLIEYLRDRGFAFQTIDEMDRRQ